MSRNPQPRIRPDSSDRPAAKLPGKAGGEQVVRVSLAAVLLQIGLMDLSLSIDNVIAAVGLAPKNKETGQPLMWPIYVGVAIAILALQAIAPHAVKLLKKYPILEPTAFILIGFVGGILVVEEAWHVITGQPVHIPPWGKFIGILFIIWVALLYSADRAVRRFVRPVVTVAFPLMKAFAGAVNLLFRPFTALFSVMRRKSSDVVE
jgi:predicted tellurium resistance membrane protein TerC